MPGWRVNAGARCGGTERRVRLGDHQSDVLLTGSGERVLVLLHAIGTDRRAWSAVTAWMPSGVRCVSVDLHGFGSAGASPPTSLDDHADDVRAVLDQLGIERAHVAGHSYGGAVAATFALRHPERLATLGLVATVVTAPRELFEERSRHARQHGVESYVDSTVARWFTPAELDDRGAPIEYVSEVLRSTPLASWVAGWQILARHDVAGRLGEITAPVTVVAGELDTACPAGPLRDATARVRDGSFHLVRGAAHMLPLERPFELARVLYAGLKRHDP